MDLWASFPGRLNGSIKNKFTFYNLNKFESNYIELTRQNDSIVFDEEVNYKNFEFLAKSVRVFIFIIYRMKLIL